MNAPECLIGRPISLPLDELIRLAGAVPLLSRLTKLRRARTGEALEPAVFGILGDLQDHLDATAPAGPPRGVLEMIDVIRTWFDTAIAAAEAT